MLILLEAAKYQCCNQSGRDWPMAQAFQECVIHPAQAEVLLHGDETAVATHAADISHSQPHSKEATASFETPLN